MTATHAGTAAVTTTGATTAAPKRVSLDPAWKSVLECATVEVLEMMAATRLTPYIPPVPAQHAQSVAQSKKTKAA